MASRLRTFGIVTIFALVLWLFAEAESLGEQSKPTSIRFVTGEGQSRFIRPVGEFEGFVSVSIVGSRSAIVQAQAELTRGVRIEPGMPGVPGTEGRHTLNLLQVIKSYPALAATGVQINSVAPQLVEVEITELVEQQAPVEVALGQVEVVGSVRVTPERVPIRLSKTLWESTRETLRVTATLSEEQMRRLPASGTVREEVRLQPPPEVESSTGFEMPVKTATVEFTVRSRAATEQFKSVPVQIILPPIEAGRWTIEVAPEDRFLSVDVSGPPDQIQRLKGAGEAVIAVVALSSDDLEARVSSKDAVFVVLRAGVMVPRPEVAFSVQRAPVRLTIEPRDPPGGAP